MNAIDLLSRALRRIGILAAGQPAQGSELEDGLATLRGMLLRMVTEGTFGELEDVIADAGAHVATQSRLLRNNTDTTSIELPETITTETGGKRPPHHGTVVVISDEMSGDTTTYLYDGDILQWLPIETISATSPVPMAKRDPNGFASLLAVELADEYGMDVREATILAAQRYQSSLAHEWSRPFEQVARPENFY